MNSYHIEFLYQALCDHKSYNGRMSWDPMLILLALEGNEENAGYEAIEGIATVNPETGENTFKKEKYSLHKYVIKKEKNEFYKSKINELIK